MKSKKKYKKKILITAGNSNIGNDLVSYFVKKKYKVFETYRKKRNILNKSNLFHLNYDFKRNFFLNDSFDLLVTLSERPIRFKFWNFIDSLFKVRIPTVFNS